MKITFITGGARSGKSSFALGTAYACKGRKAYLATAEALDQEMRERIGKHKEERGADWDTFEEPVKISQLLNEINNRYEVIIIDCLTLWLSNIMQTSQGKEAEIIDEFINGLQSFKDPLPPARHQSQLFIVSNEVGMGIVPDNELARRYRDLAGFINQKAAEAADEVYLVTAGIPVKIK